ncbi:MAG: hypothetical protein ACR2OJ_03070 [Hyphomicrobiales bacterium]
MNKTRKYTPSHTASHEHFKERFQYWQGASGHRYICSIYAPHSCPPLPGAVYIAVKREEDGARSARAVGRFASFFDTGVGNAQSLARKAGANEIHVHLLAEDDSNAERTVRDLKKALAPAVRVRAQEPSGIPPQRRTPLPASLTPHKIETNQIELFG